MSYQLSVIDLMNIVSYIVNSQLFYVRFSCYLPLNSELYIHIDVTNQGVYLTAFDLKCL